MKKYVDMTMEDKKILVSGGLMKDSFLIVSDCNDALVFFQGVGKGLGFNLSVDEVACVFLDFYSEKRNAIINKEKGGKMSEGSYSEAPIEEILDYGEKNNLLEGDFAQSLTKCLLTIDKAE